MHDAPLLSLLEGLPHELWEGDAFKEELAQKPTVEFHAFHFYTQPVAVEPQDALKLKALLTSAALVQNPPGVIVMKQCGGFHPDYLIRWRAHDQEYSVLICFGCGEARCFGPDGEADCDVSEAAVAEFKTILKTYRRNRPS